jgi:hypothetical protein
MIDAALDYVAASDKMCVCSAEPSDYSNMTTVVDLATIAMTPGSGNGDFLKANDVSGRKLTMTAKSGATIDHSGTATHIGLGLASGTTLRYVTTCTSQALTGGGTVDVPSWKINIADPT